MAEIQWAAQEQVGKTAAPSTIYRLLDGRGWRKMVIRPRHPSADIAAQDALFVLPWVNAETMSMLLTS